MCGVSYKLLTCIYSFNPHKNLLMCIGSIITLTLKQEKTKAKRRYRSIFGMWTFQSSSWTSTQLTDVTASLRKENRAACCFSPEPALWCMWSRHNRHFPSICSALRNVLGFLQACSYYIPSTCWEISTVSIFPSFQIQKPGPQGGTMTFKCCVGSGLWSMVYVILKQVPVPSSYPKNM